MKEAKIYIDEVLFAQLEVLCDLRGWPLERGLAIAAETGVRDLLWAEKFPENKAEYGDALAMRRELLSLSSQLASLKFQNFELSRDNRNYEIREGSLRSRISNLEVQLKKGEK